MLFRSNSQSNGQDTENNEDPQGGDSNTVSGMEKKFLKNGSNGGNSSATLNPKVYVLTEEESRNLQQGVEEIETVDAGKIVFYYNESADENINYHEKDILLIPKVEEGVLTESVFFKIETIDQIERIISFTTPAPDEVFDELNIDVDSKMTQENLEKVETIPGVELISGESAYQDFQNEVQMELNENGKTSDSALDISENEPALFASTQDLTGSLGDYSLAKSAETESDEKSKISLDIGNDEKEKGDEGEEGLHILLKVKDLDLLKYFLKTDKEIASVVVNGKIGLENVQAVCKAEGKRGNPGFYDNVSFEGSGDLTAKVGVKGELKASIEEMKEKRTDKKKINLGIASVSGLSEDLIPIACFTFGVGAVILEGRSSIADALPLSASIIVTMDAAGQINGSLSFDFTAEIPFNTGKYQIMEDGKLVLRKENIENEPIRVSYGFTFKVAADVDIRLINVNVGVYIFNVNLARCRVTAFGGEVSGSLEIKAVRSDGLNKVDIDWENQLLGLYTRVGIELKLSVAAKSFLPAILRNMGVDFDLQWTLYEKYWFYKGEKPTEYDDKTMSYDQIRAVDEDNIYFKENNGNLVKMRRNGSNKKAICTEEFFIICGIDKSYIYLMTQAEEGFDIIRVSKDGKTSRKIPAGIIKVLEQDSKYIYVVPNSEQTKVKRIDKKTLLSKVFCELEGGNTNSIFDTPLQVQSLLSRDEDTYLLIGHSSNFWSSTTKYYEVSKNLEDVKDVKEVEYSYEYYFKESMGSYNCREALGVSGYLRGNADEIYWESEDQMEKVNVPSISGWNPCEEGIFVQQSNLDEASAVEYPYEIVLYQAKDGQPRNIWKVKSQQAFFTLQKYKEKWYFVDQTDKEYLLYRADSLDKNCEVIDRRNIEDYSADLSNCGTSLVGEFLFFYTIKDTNCRMLYKYDLDMIG